MRSSRLRQVADVYVEAHDAAQLPQDEMGGVDRSEPLLVVAGVPCALRPLSSYMTRSNNGRVQTINATVYFSGDPTPTGLTNRHRLVVRGCARKEDDGTYNVAGATDVMARGKQVQVSVEKV